VVGSSGKSEKVGVESLKQEDEVWESASEDEEGESGSHGSSPLLSLLAALHCSDAYSSRYQTSTWTRMRMRSQSSSLAKKISANAPSLNWFPGSRSGSRSWRPLYVVAFSYLSSC
jgi:hypothetical protein